MIMPPQIDLILPLVDPLVDGRYRLPELTTYLSTTAVMLIATIGTVFLMGLFILLLNIEYTPLIHTAVTVASKIGGLMAVCAYAAWFYPRFHLEYVKSGLAEYSLSLVNHTGFGQLHLPSFLIGITIILCISMALSINKLSDWLTHYVYQYTQRTKSQRMARKVHPQESLETVD